MRYVKLTLIMRTGHRCSLGHLYRWVSREQERANGPRGCMAAAWRGKGGKGEESEENKRGCTFLGRSKRAGARVDTEQMSWREKDAWREKTSPEGLRHAVPGCRSRGAEPGVHNQGYITRAY